MFSFWTATEHSPDIMDSSRYTAKVAIDSQKVVILQLGVGQILR
jgi:hypothetical protein